MTFLCPFWGGRDALTLLIREDNKDLDKTISYTYGDSNGKVKITEGRQRRTSSVTASPCHLPQRGRKNEAVLVPSSDKMAEKGRFVEAVLLKQPLL